MAGWMLWAGLALAQQDAVAPPREAYNLAVVRCADVAAIAAVRPSSMPDPSVAPDVDLILENQGTATCTWSGLVLGGLEGGKVVEPADTSTLVLAPGAKLLIRVRLPDPRQTLGDVSISVPAIGGPLTVHFSAWVTVQPGAEPVGGIGGLIPARGVPFSGGPRGTSTGSLPTVTAGIPTVSGQDRKLVEATVARQMSSIRYCYQRDFQKSPALAGEITVAFTIAADGTVPSADVNSSTLSNRAAEECIVGRFLRMQFPAPSGGSAVKATYPFSFDPG